MRRLLLPSFTLTLIVLAAACSKPQPVAPPEPLAKPDDPPAASVTPEEVPAPPEELVAQKDEPEPAEGPLVREKLGKLTLTLDPGGHTATITRIFFTPDSKQLITLGMDNTIRFWDVATGQQLKVLYPPGVEGLRAAALSGDGKRLAIASVHLEGDKRIRVICVLALPEGKIERVLRGHGDNPVESIAMSFDGKRLAANSLVVGDRTIRVWDLGGDKDVPERVFEKKQASGLALSPDGSRLAYGGGAAAGKEKGVIIDLATGNTVAATAGGHLAWSPDGKTLATGALKVGLRLWDADGKLLSQHLQGKSVDWVAFSGDSQTVLAAGATGTGGNFQATLIEVATGKQKQFQPEGIKWWAGRVGGLSPDGQFAATGGGGGGKGEDAGAPEAFIWKMNDGAVHRRLAARGWLTPKTIGAAWSADGKAIAWDRGPKAPSFHLGELRFGPPIPEEAARRAVSRQGDLSLERNAGDPVKVLTEGKPPVELKLPAIVTDATLVGKDRAAVAGRKGGGRGGDMWLFDARTGEVLRRFAPTWASSIAPSPDGRFLLATSHAEQTLRLYSLDRDKPLLSLYVQGQDWVLWTPEGYYAATPGGERLIGWTVDNGIDQMPTYYPAERFRKQLYRPELIKKVIELGSVEAALKALDGDKAKPVDLEKLLPPKCALQLLEQKGGVVKLKVSAEAQAKGQPVTALRLLVDGRPLPNREGYKEFEKGTAMAADTWTVTLPEGEHHLSVLARSPDASAVSEVVAVKHVSPAKQPVLHVLAVGINYAHDPALKLDFAAADARAIADAFKQGCQGPLFTDVKGEPLVNEKATRKAVLAALADLRKQPKPNDLVVVFFAGHGVKQEDHQFYLLPVDANVNDLARTAISGAELCKTLGEFPCQVLLLLDACHSAAGVKAFRPATDDAARAFTDDEVGVPVLCAAMGHEKAIEKKELGHGLFTQAVVEGVTGAEVPRHPLTGQQYLHHLHSHVFDRVLVLSGDKQHPFLSLPWVVESFPLRQLPVKSPGER